MADPLFDEVVPRVTGDDLGPKLAVSIADPEAFAAWCAERGWTPESYMAHFERLLTPTRSNNLG